MTPRTEQGRWLLDHQGLINATGELTGNSIDLRQSILTIEAEAVTLDAARDSAGLDVAAKFRTAIYGLISERVVSGAPGDWMRFEDAMNAAYDAVRALSEPKP